MFQYFLRDWVYTPYCYIRFGEIRAVVVARIDGIPCEIVYVGRNGRLVGYWAYGAFDPNQPYRGWLH